MRTCRDLLRRIFKRKLGTYQYPSGEKRNGKVAEKLNLEIQEAKERISKVSTLLMAERSKNVRIRLLDGKSDPGMECIVNTAVSKAFSATGIKRYRELATENMIFLLEHFFNKSTERFYHTWKNNAAKYPAYLMAMHLSIDAPDQFAGNNPGMQVA